MDEHSQQTYTILLTFLRVRIVELAIQAIYPSLAIRCPTHLSLGQELPASILGAICNKDDWFFSSHRCHAHYLAKGGSLVRMLKELTGKKDGCCGGVGGSMHLTDRLVNFVTASAIVGNSIPWAVGVALKQKNVAITAKKTANIAVSFFGDGALEEGTCYESFLLASQLDVPSVFVVENNRFSVNTDISVRRPSSEGDLQSLLAMPASLGMNVFRFEYSNGEDEIERLRDAIRQCRHEMHPLVIGFDVSREAVHCGYEPETAEFLREFEPVQNSINQFLMLLQSSSNVKSSEVVEAILPSIALDFSNADLELPPSFWESIPEKLM